MPLRRAGETKINKPDNSGGVTFRRATFLPRARVVSRDGGAERGRKRTRHQNQFVGFQSVLSAPPIWALGALLEACLPAAVLVRSLTLELVGREDRKNAFFRTEVLPLYPWVGLQIICQHCGEQMERCATSGKSKAGRWSKRNKDRRGGKPEKGRKEQR